MKILYGVTKSNFGGAQRYVFELAEWAKSQGHDVAVTCGDTDHSSNSLVARLEEIDIPVFLLESAARDIRFTKEFTTLWCLYRIVRKYKPDVIHLNSPKLGGLGSVVARMAGVKHIVYTNHGWPFKESRPSWQIFLIKFFSWLTILFNSKIIVLSKTELDMVRRWPLVNVHKHNTPSGKFFIVANSVKRFTYLEQTDALIALLGEQRYKDIFDLSGKEKSFVLGNISELHRNKGYIYALQGLHRFLNHHPELIKDTHVHFIIVSEGEERQQLMNIVKNLNLEAHVTFVGYVHDARKYLKAFDTLLFTSIKEGLPFAILESGFVETPIITTSVGAIPEIISGHGTSKDSNKNLKNTGYVIRPKNIDDVCEAIAFALGHSTEMIERARNLKKIIDTSYNFENQSQRILEIYKNS